MSFVLSKILVELFGVRLALACKLTIDQNKDNKNKTYANMCNPSQSFMPMAGAETRIE